MVSASFHWADYLIFVLVLVISTAIGIFFAWKDRNKQNASDFLLGGRKMGILPVSLSLMATLLSAVMVLGVPSEVYYNGSIYWLILFSNFLVYPVAAHMFLPVFHNLGITSAYEYLELRFNTLMRILGCVNFQIQMILSMALGLFAPAIALNQVMNLSILVSILVIGAICTFYTAIGGLKAVMWTDAFQMVMIMVGFLACMIKGTSQVGGFNVIWERAINGSKLDIVNFDPSPFERHTFWTIVIGGGITTMTVYGSNQAMIQRYLSMETIKKAQIALYLQLPAGLIVTTLFVYAGLLLYAKYPVDPVSDCTIQLPDQLMPWLVMDVLGDFHGFPGLLLSCIFSASLSTISSGINAVALVCMEDLVQPAYKSIKGTLIQEPRATIISKILAFVCGGVTIGLAFVSEYFGSLILQVGFSIYGMIGGPLLGVFICAMFIPMVNSWGALIGMFVGLILSSWLSVGAILMANANTPPPPICEAFVDSNMTTMIMTTVVTSNIMDNVTAPVLMDSKSGLEMFYSLSYLWYSAFAVIVVIVVAVPISCLTGGTRNRPVDKKLLSPFYFWMTSYASITDDYTHKDKVLANTQNGFNTVYAVDLAIKPPIDGYHNPAFETKM